MSSDPKVKGNGTNWQAAKAYYLGLDPTNRSYAAVARRFQVSDARVGVVARAEGWLEEAQRVDARVERRAITAVVRTRADLLARTIEIAHLTADLTRQHFTIADDGRLVIDGEAPTLEQLLKRMPGIFKMAQLAAGEATDRVSVADVQPVLIAFARIAVLAAPAEERAQVMLELEAASSGLVSLEAAA